MPVLPGIPERTLWTVADLEALPDDGLRYEILHGELLVTPLPSSRHQRVAARLLLALGNWCRAHSGWLFLATGGEYINETTWLEPDIAVYASPEYLEQSWREMPPPLLVVEVLSRSTQRRDRHRKRPAYLAHGVGEVWLADAEARSIERWTAASEFPVTFHDAVTWAPDPSFAPLTLTCAEVFGASQPPIPG